MNWEPFVLAPTGSRPDAPRPLETPEGVGDRLRTAAFAEIQAREAFLWAAETYDDACDELKLAWRRLAGDEERHLNSLLQRMVDLKVDVKARKVSDQLWHSLVSCKTAVEFALYIASAEERGRKAGVRFYEALIDQDPITAQIFGKIAEEEVAHIALVDQFFPAQSLLARKKWS